MPWNKMPAREQWGRSANRTEAHQYMDARHHTPPPTRHATPAAQEGGYYDGTRTHPWDPRGEAYDYDSFREYAEAQLTTARKTPTQQEVDKHLLNSLYCACQIQESRGT